MHVYVAAIVVEDPVQSRIHNFNGGFQQRRKTYRLVSDLRDLICKEPEPLFDTVLLSR